MNKKQSPLKSKDKEKSWEKEVKEYDEMMGMVLDIMARTWPDVK